MNITHFPSLELFSINHDKLEDDKDLGVPTTQSHQRKILVNTIDSSILPPLLEPPLKLERIRTFVASDPTMEMQNTNNNSIYGNIQNENPQTHPSFGQSLSPLNNTQNHFNVFPNHESPNPYSHNNNQMNNNLQSSAFNNPAIDSNYSNNSSLQLLSNRMLNISTPIFQVRKPSMMMNSFDFERVATNPMVTINPKKLQFIPADVWQNENISFGVLVATFFRKRNSMHCKFSNKLYNALKISSFFPDFIPIVGIEWVTDSVFRVHRAAFARLLGVRAIEGGLFHQQGNFPSHGFYELSFTESDELSKMYGYGPVDLSQYRFITHSTGLFRRSSTEIDLEKCKWNGK
ncbi:hypothetical protein TRFO_11901 [Tritrichomonas foetus]|uniref:Initiator binding domain-containing protein n=1 Tax=Tritrichomonas foetus TaxID=1144522 RepID=A0A1J4J106_9EUKA|nr:hypothetical protein TRFO_11901 [Tritrichomonas foetus]|eukprot:OHS93286.1 hypothetical protein TRFO_11901 [Tritrichomonas foetus]